MNFAQNRTYLTELMGMSQYAADPDYLAIEPAAIQDAEQRLYRELDLLMTRQTDTSGALTPNSRAFTLPTTKGVFIVLEQVSLFSPAQAGTQGPPLLPVSKEALEQMWPSDTPVSSPSVPTMWAQVNQTTIELGPPPDAAYPAVCFGTQRPAPLSASNPQTILSLYLPDLFLAAEMVFMSGWMKDFANMTAPAAPGGASWESHCSLLQRSAAVEEFRKKWQGPGWTARLPPEIATPPQS